MEPVLFSLVPREHLEDVLDNLQKFTGLNIQLLDGTGKLIMSFGRPQDYCARLSELNIFSSEECYKFHRKAGSTAYSIGEAYVFSCHANLNNIAFPLVNGDDLVGNIIIGPFLMDAPDSTLVSSFAESIGISPLYSLELYDDLFLLPIVEPLQVNRLRKLLEHLLSSLLPSERAILHQKQQQMYQQAKISETIHVFKGQTSPTDLKFFYGKEKDLLVKVKTGNIPQAKALLNELIGYALFSEGGVLELVKPRAVELVSLLSRVAMDGGADPDRMYELSASYISRIYSENSTIDICVTLQEVVENFMSAAFYEKDKGNPYIRKALRFMYDNYGEHLDLSRVAEYVGLSPNYFSSLFNDTVGVSFKEHLNRIRVEASKQLLMSTDYDMTDIAVAMGFPDQSYYCKVFKKTTGMSPGKFRNSLN